MTNTHDLESIRGLDLYLLDQILKGKLHSGLKVLDAGCGSGRNLTVLNRLGFDVAGFDKNEEIINDLQRRLPHLRTKITSSPLELFPTNKKYDYIIVNAVLHFAESHLHFDLMFNRLAALLAPNGQLFIRMTSNLAIEQPFDINSNGIAHLPDESYRYLLDMKRLSIIMSKNSLEWVEPIKTVNVNSLRCMSTIILQNSGTPITKGTC